MANEGRGQEEEREDDGFRNLAAAAAIIQIQTCPIARALVALYDAGLNPNFRSVAGGKRAGGGRGEGKRGGLKRNSEQHPPSTAIAPIPPATRLRIFRERAARDSESFLAPLAARARWDFGRRVDDG